MKEVTFLQSSMVKLQVATFLLVIAVSFHMYVTSAALLFSTGWYAQKVFGDAK